MIDYYSQHINPNRKWSLPPQDVLLEFLLNHHNRIVRHDQIIKAIPWIITKDYLYNLIRRLRAVYAIETVRGVGYIYKGRKEARGDQLK